MVDAWISAFRDPMFLPFVVGGTAVSMGAFLLFALPLTWVAWADPAWARRWRIGSKPPDVARWFRPGLTRWLVNNAILFALILLVWPLLRPLSGVHAGPLPAWWVVVGQVLLFVYVDDLLYYGMHRAMHHGWAWERIHRLHHRVVRPCAITGHYMHPVEFVLTGILMLACPIVLGVHVVTLYVWIVVRQLEAAEGHSGYHVPFSPLSWIPGGHGADHHDFHHTKVMGNYAGFLAWVDRAFGTYAKGYAAWRADPTRHQA